MNHPPTNDSSDIYCLKKIRFEINGSVYLFLIRGGGKNTIPIMSGIVVKFPRYISPRADLIAFSGEKAFCLRTTRAILSSTTKWNENNARPIRLLPKEAQHICVSPMIDGTQNVELEMHRYLINVVVECTRRNA